MEGGILIAIIASCVNYFSLMLSGYVILSLGLINPN
jgi:hypothetical protein